MPEIEGKDFNLEDISPQTEPEADSEGASFSQTGSVSKAQTAIPIQSDAEPTSAVIAGHRSWNGYKYFLDIELPELGDEVTITNLWETPAGHRAFSF